jgi:hypothetical protein
MQNSVDGSIWSSSAEVLVALSLSAPEEIRLLEEFIITLLADDRIQVDTFYTSKAGVAIAATTGTISAISSFIIIYIMYKSKQGFKKSVYHRIMLGMSISDIIVSVAIAFTTLPMPKDMIYRQFEGLLVRGNISTCTAQGFFFMLGGSCTAAYIASLMLYYLFSIRYKKSEEEIAKRFEPWLHAIPIIYSISISSSLVAFEALNPTPFECWCTAMTIPYWCPSTPNDDSCILRAKRGAYIVHHIMSVFFILIVVVSIGSLAMIISGTYEQEKLLKFYLQSVDRASRVNSDRVRFDYQDTWAISKQALAYFVAYASVNIFPVITLFLGKTNLGTGAFPVFHLILRPLQGFFNLLIFSYHKVDNIQRAVPGTGFSTALHQVFFPSPTEETPEFIVSSLSIVRRDFERNTGDPEGGGNMDILENVVANSVIPPSSTGDDAEVHVGPKVEEQAVYYPLVADKIRNQRTKSNDPAGDSLSRNDSHDLSVFTRGDGGTKEGGQSLSRSGLITTTHTDTFEENDISYASPGPPSSTAGDSRFSFISGALSFGVEKGDQKR